MSPHAQKWYTPSLPDLGSGSGSSLNVHLLGTCGLATLVASAVCCYSVYSHMKNYRKPHLQRQVIRIMIMVPLYAISSLISLFSLEAAFFIDAFRDIYEAFVIYCFFHLLLAYLGGDRSLLIMLHGRPPKRYLFPVNIFRRECDVSDPFVFLALRRGIFQYVQVKPILAIVTMILKATNKYHEGVFRGDDGYLYISIIYNTSICISLYCLAQFWVVVHDDILAFRPMPKFLCVKGVLFFSFWQSIVISIFAASGVIKNVGPYTDEEHISIAINDMFICFEMPLFAIAHMFAFSYRDYKDAHIHLAARMPFYYALRDAFGLKDVVEDAKATMEGAMSYRYYEPAEGGMHQGSGRDRRIRAGLRYAEGGKKKYWLPQARNDATMTTGPINALNKALQESRIESEGYAPLMAEQAADVVHQAEDGSVLSDEFEEDEFDRTSLDFGVEEDVEVLFAKSRLMEFGDFNCPTIDVSDEEARRAIREVEAGIVGWRTSAVGRGTRERLLSAPTPGYGTAGAGGPGPGERARRPNGAERSHSTDGQGKGKGVDRPNGVYGAWADEIRPRASQDGEGDGHAIVRGGEGEDLVDLREAHEDGAVVDMAPPPELTLDGVRLKLSKLGDVAANALGVRGSSTSTPPSRPKSPLLPSLNLNLPSVNIPVPSILSPAPPSTLPLPSDAVDLLVEDPSAAEEEATRERRRGEPALKAGERRMVYRRGVEMPGEEADREVQVEVRGGAGEEGEGRLEEAVVKVREARDGEGGEGDGGTAALISVAESPPRHGHVQLEEFERGFDDNPWA